MAHLIRRVRWGESISTDPEQILSCEWLVANGLGGYSSGTVSGVCTRRYHGLLIAALPAPLGRIVMLSHLEERIGLTDGTETRLNAEERIDRSLDLESAGHLAEFRIEDGLPVWRYQVGKVVLEKRLFMPHMQRTTYVAYRLLTGASSAKLLLRPALKFRPLEAPVNIPFKGPHLVTATQGRYEVSSGTDLPALRLLPYGEDVAFAVDEMVIPEVLYRVEEGRGYEAIGDLWSPGRFEVELV